jgi:hypothetical protein
MNVARRSLALFSCVALFVAVAPLAHANTVSGTAYCDIKTDSGGQGSNYAIQTPTLAQLGNAESTSAGQCASFTASAINFASGVDSTAASSHGVTGGDSLNNFLNYGGNLLTSSYSSAHAGANGGQAILSNGGQSDNGTLIVLSGTNYLTNGESITLNHDDGALIYVCSITSVCTLGTGGIPTDVSDYSLISGLPSNSGTQTYDGQSPFDFTGTTGSYDFLLIYNSNYLQPSDLQSNIDSGTAPSPTPEPSSLILLGTGVLGAAGMFRRRYIA